jgi:hypothetical protein
VCISRPDLRERSAYGYALLFLKFYDPRPCFIGFCVTYFAGYRTPAIGVATVAGRDDGLPRIVLAAGQLGASAGDIVIIPTDTPSIHHDHRTAIEVVAELDAGQIFPVEDADGTTRLVQVYRSDMPWSRQAAAGL